MPQEQITYTIPASSTTPGSEADIILTYLPQEYPDNTYIITNASGTYNTLNSSGGVVDSDTITGLSTSNSNPMHEQSQVISIGQQPYVSNTGIVFTIDNDADSNDGAGDVNFFSALVNGSEEYFENGANPNAATGVTESAVCFASGTRIRTTRGDVAVEALVVGDVAVIASGAHRPIRWLGHRVIDCRNHPRSHQVRPIRIEAHAFGDNRPRRDLLVSPSHAICVDVVSEVLIPARALINGTTIQQVEVDSVTYWHVELDSHDVILADNLPCESYLEMGNRSFFAESAVADIAATPDARAPTATHADFCRPFHEAGALVEAVRHRLRARADAAAVHAPDASRAA